MKRWRSTLLTVVMVGGAGVAGYATIAGAQQGDPKVTTTTGSVTTTSGTQQPTAVAGVTVSNPAAGAPAQPEVGQPRFTG